jgi:hypothetical protein
MLGKALVGWLLLKQTPNIEAKTPTLKPNIEAKTPTLKPKHQTTNSKQHQHPVQHTAIKPNPNKHSTRTCW